MSGCWFGQQSRGKGMSHIISMTRAHQWWFRNFMQNWSRMHLWGHSSIKFCGHVTLGLKIHHFFLFKSAQCFQNMLLYQFIHLSESILGVRENFHNIHPSGAYTSFFKNWSWSENFFKEKLEVNSFQKHVGFSAKRYIFVLVCFCYFFIRILNSYG